MVTRKNPTAPDRKGEPKRSTWPVLATRYHPTKAKRVVRVAKKLGMRRDEVVAEALDLWMEQQAA